MTDEQLYAVLTWQYPTIGKAYSVVEGELVFHLWLDRSTNQPSAVPQPTMAQVVAWWPSLPATALPPDWKGFLLWLAQTFDPPTLTAIGNNYSTFFGYCQFGNAVGVAWCITDAHTKGSITPAQYALFQGANTTYSLGMTLP